MQNEFKFEALCRAFAAAAPHQRPALLLELDALGIFPAPNEACDAFVKRNLAMAQTLRDFYAQITPEGTVIAPDDPGSSVTLKSTNRVSSETILDAQRVLVERYGVRAEHLVVYFSEEPFGLLWAGCTLIYEQYPFPIVLLRRAFEKKELFLKIYSRSELIAHESVHAIRAPLESDDFEEIMAYSISKSALRRGIGGAFQSALDALIFIVPVLLVLGLQIALVFFPEMISPALKMAAFLFALSGPCYLLLRNVFHKHLLRRAVKNLTPLCADPMRVLFRCTDEEIRAFSRMKTADIQHKIESEREHNCRTLYLDALLTRELKAKGKEK